jgi:hypothetical protein
MLVKPTDVIVAATGDLDVKDGDVDGIEVDSVVGGIDDAEGRRVDCTDGADVGFTDGRADCSGVGELVVNRLVGKDEVAAGLHDEGATVVCNDSDGSNDGDGEVGFKVGDRDVKIVVGELVG